MLFSKPIKAISIDIGSHSVKTVQVSKAGGRLRVDGAGYALIDRGQYNADPIVAQADAVREALRRMPLAQSLVVGALPAQTVVIRYPRFPEMPHEQLSASIEAEAGQNIPYELSEVFLDWTVLDRVTEGDSSMLKVLLVAAKSEVIDSRVQVADESGVQYAVLGVDSLALADAAEGCDFLRVGESVALINLGASTTSIHFVKDGVSNFIRDVNWGARELIQAISKARRCELDDAERLLVQAGSEMAGDEGLPPDEGAPEGMLPEDAVEELPSAEPPPEDDLSLGGSLLDPLEEELGGLDDSLGGLDEAPKPAAAAPQEQDIKEILAMPLGRLVAEVRRSFDYYEQQLYEQPVDRLIVSGGVAHLTQLKNTLSEELGLEAEIADPTSSALLMGDQVSLGKMVDHPALFMVAVGLAVRGAAEL